MSRTSTSVRLLPREPRATDAAVAGAVCGATVALAGASGGFFPVSWGIGALVAAWIAALALLLGKPARPGRRALALLLVVVALEGWTALSAVWSASLPLSFVEAERTLLYALAVAAVVALGGRAPIGAIAAGVLVAAVVVCCWDLVLGGGGSAHRGFESEAPPVGYANSLALLAAIGAVLAIGLAVAGRPLALVALGAFVPVLVQQQSTGSWAALAAALVVLALLRLPLRVATTTLALLAVAAAFAVGAWVESRGHERGHYWSAGAEAVVEHPLLGSGAGTYALSWLRLRDAPIDTLDAHSLYLETLGELGVVGLALVLLLAAIPVAAAVSARRRPHVALGGAAYSAWVLGAGIDFHWEMASVTVPALLLGAALAGEADRPGPPLGIPARTASAAAVGLAAAAAALALAGNELAARAEDALANGDPAGAAAAAHDAETWQPWSPRPWELLGFAEVARGNRAAARSAFATATAKDPRDPSLWVALAQVSAGEPRRRALARVARLNPLYFGGSG